MIPQLNSIYFYNNTCNQLCKHCWVNLNNGSIKDENFNFKDFTKLVYEAKKIGVSTFKLTGGEPTLLPYFSDALLLLYENKFNILVESNGTLINREIAEKIKKYNVFISISLDSLIPEKHNKIRNMKDAYKKTIIGMNYLKENDVDFQLIVSLSKINEYEILKFISVYDTFGAKSLKINNIMKVGRAKEMLHNDELLTLKEIMDIYELIKESEEYKNKNIIFDFPLAFLNVKSIRRNGVCGIKNIMGIFSNGIISFCGIGNLHTELIAGRFPEISIKEAWETGKIFNEIRTSLPNKIKGVCSNCIYRNYDMGGCRALAYEQYKDITAPNPVCQYAYEQGLFPKNKLIEEKEYEELLYSPKR